MCMLRVRYDDPPVVVLTDNYRSVSLYSNTLELSFRTDRLEQTMDGLSKELTAHRSGKSAVQLHEYSSALAERQAVAAAIRARIEDGVEPESIAVFARRHHELVALLPYLSQQGIAVNYERRDDALSHDVIRLIEHLLLIIDALHRDAHDEADALLPEILAHPAFGYNPVDIYQLSLASYRNRQLWLELMQANPVFKPFADWLIIRSAAIHVESLEQQIDEVLGSSQAISAIPRPPLASDTRERQLLSSYSRSTGNVESSVSDGSRVAEIKRNSSIELVINPIR